MTKKANGEGSINKYKNSWRATLTLGRDDDGKLIRKQFYGRTKLETKSKMDEYKTKYNSGLLSSDDKMTLQQWFKIWLFEHKANEINPSTIEKYNSYYKNYIKDSIIGLIKLKDIKGANIQSYYNVLLREKGKTPMLVKGINKVLKASFEQAIKEHYVLFNPCKIVTLPKEGVKEEVQIFTLDEQKKLLTSLDGYRNKALIITALGTGLRMGELLGLKWDDIDMLESTLTVKRTVKRTPAQNLKDNTPRFMLGTPKTSNSYRNVPIPSNVLKKLELHFKSQLEERAYAGDAYENNNLVFPNELGAISQVSTIQKSYNNLLKKCGIPHKKFHALRHTYASRLFENDVPLKTVQVLLGHSNIRITADIYTHVMGTEKIKAVEKINDLFYL